MSFAHVRRSFRLAFIAVLILNLIYLPALPVYAQSQKPKREIRTPKPPRTDAPTIKEDLKPALATKKTPSETLVNIPNSNGLPAVSATPSLPNLEVTKQQQGEKEKTDNFTATPSTQCDSRDEICKKAKGEKPKQVSQIQNPLRQLLAYNNPAPFSLFNERAALKSVTEATTPLLLQAPAQNYGDMWGARMDSHNRIGGEGEDLHSGNYHWSLPLVNLSGRSGLDLGLTLSYNSLVWMKSGNTMFYNFDQGFPSPGFRLGFPALSGQTYNATLGKWTIQLTLPSGQRIELRQIGSSNFFESFDSSYFQLETNYAATTLYLRTSDGTQLRYQMYGGIYQCDQIKDANGNYISATYTSFGKISTITDTLGRVLNFAYDAYYHLTDITQTWNGQSHLWAHFDYANITINTNFTGGIYYLDGAANNAQIAVLSRVITNDGARYTFVYNSYGQATHFWRYGQEDNQRACVGYLMDLPSNGLTDCPRPYLRGEWAVEWFGGWAESYFTFAADGSVGQVTAPNGTVYKEFFATSGWQKGLPSSSETWAGGIKRKWTTTAWTQDDINLAYQKNPRPTETNVYDEATNRRRVTTGYRTITLPSGSSFTIPNKTTEYNADATTPYRSSYTDYEEGTAYLSRQLLGLPKLSRLYIGDQGAVPPTNVTPVTKVEYLYDEGATYLQAMPAAATQHDAAFGGSYRGNVTRVRRYDVNTNNYVENQWGYNTAGSVIFSRDALNNQTNISYADAFSDSVNRNTFAYPTTVTDPGGYSSTLKYNFDFSAITRTQDPKGAAFSREYDWAGRLLKQTNLVNQSYTRYYYAPSHFYVQSWATVNDLNPANEFYSITLFDGMNRTRATVEDHPGSVGGQKSVYNVYDNMGRLSQQSNPTEIDGNWTPVGDDQALGYVWKQIAYDWNSRPIATTNTDGTQQLMEYSSCGCAGSTEITQRDEGQLVNGVLTRRKKKISLDVFGRAFQEQVFDWNSATVKSTTLSTFNVRDQATSVKQYEGGSTGTFQEITMAYDGHGRLQSRKYPIETYASSFTYDNADRPLTVTDARGASATYSYNSRNLRIGVSYTVPAGVAATPNVSYAYDEVGNRTQMIDGQGQTDYAYDTLSRMTSETRYFNGLSSSRQLTYTYNLIGQLTSYKDETNNNTISYSYYKNGTMSAVSGSTFGGVNQYVNEMKYRTFGAIKAANYGSGYALSTSYNIRQQLNEYKLSTASTTAQWSQYQYHADGNIKFSQNKLDAQFDRGFAQDYAGRLAEAYSGVEARNFLNQVSNPATNSVPYRQNYTHNVWGDLTARDGKYWSGADSFTAVFTNGRRSTLQYDAAGNVTNDTNNIYTYDAESRNVNFHPPQWNNGTNFDINLAMDGDGLTTKRYGYYAGTLYYLRSSVLGGKIVTEIHGETISSYYGQNWTIGSKSKGYVYASGVVGEQTVDYYYSAPTTPIEYVKWKHTDPVTGSDADTWVGGVSIGHEFDPMGVDTGFEDPANTPPPSVDPEVPTYSGGSANGVHCILDNVSIDCADAFNLLRTRTAAIAPQERIKRVIYQGQPVWAPFVAYADGYSGYQPTTARYTGNGQFLPFSQPPTTHHGYNGMRRTLGATANDTDFVALNGATGEALLGRQTEFVNVISGGLFGLGDQRPKPQPAPTPVAQTKPIACDTSLIFSISTGKLQILVDGNVYGTINGDSGTNKKGRQCLNNPSCQEYKSEGPIPEGNYTISTKSIYSPGILGIAIMNRPKLISGGDWGSFRVPILPVQGTNSFGRSGFFLHGGKFEGSAGCIDVGGGWLGNEITEDLLKTIRRDRDGIIPLRVIR